MSVDIEYPHISIDGKGTATIRGTTMKVVELIAEKLAYGWSPEELHFQHPDLTMGQIHGALAYYWDHAEEMDRDVAARLKDTEELAERARNATSPLVRKLKARGLL